MNRKELTKALKDIDARRMDAFAAASNDGSRTTKDVLQAMAEATTPEDIDTLNDAIQAVRDPFARLVITRAIEVFEEWERSGRCVVCGMTEAQAKAANYDCVNEC